MYPILLQTHSGLRYLVLLSIVALLIVSAIGLFGKRPFTPQARMVALIAFILAHLQFTVGLLLYFVSPRVHLSDGNAMATQETRYWTTEHITGNIIAIVLFTLAYMTAKRADTDAKKYSRLFWYTLAGVVVLAGSLYANSHAPGFFGKAS